MTTVNDHPPDCACCVSVRFTPGRPAAAAASARARTPTSPPFCPRAAPRRERGRGRGRGEGEEGEEEPEEDEAPPDDALFKAFDAHVEKLDAARLRRIETLSFKSALEDDGKEEINADATQDEVDGLGVWLAGDEFQGDVNYRTLQKLLTRVDQRGFERSAQQLEARPRLWLRLAPGAWRLPHPLPFSNPDACAARAQFHVAFMKAAARVIYRGSWETERPAIMKRYGWETSNSEVLIRRARGPFQPTC